MYPRPTDSGLIALWRFNNDILDSGPSGYNLSLNGLDPVGFNFSTRAPDGSYSLSGFAPNDRWLYNNTNLTGVMCKSGIHSFTLEFQIYPTGIIVEEGGIFDEYSSVGGGRWGIYLFTSNKIRAYDDDLHVISNNIAPSTWTHVAYTYNGDTRVMRSYLNNVIGSSGIITRPNDVSDLFIGRATILGRKSSALIKNFAIYNYIKTEFQSISNITVSVPSASYGAQVYDSSFSPIFTGIDSKYFDNTTNEILLIMTGIISGQLNLSVTKNNWTAARKQITGVYPGDYYDLI